jgi:hypothetical protein
VKPTIRNMYLHDRCFFLNRVVWLVGLQIVSRELNILSWHMQICNDIIMQKPMNHVHIDKSNSIQPIQKKKKAITSSLLDCSEETNADQMHMHLHILGITQEEAYFSFQAPAF